MRVADGLLDVVAELHLDEFVYAILARSTGSPIWKRKELIAIYQRLNLLPMFSRQVRADLYVTYIAGSVLRFTEPQLSQSGLSLTDFQSRPVALNRSSELTKSNAYNARSGLLCFLASSCF